MDTDSSGGIQLKRWVSNLTETGPKGSRSKEGLSSDLSESTPGLSPRSGHFTLRTREREKESGIGKRNK